MEDKMVHHTINANCNVCNKVFKQTHRAIHYCSDKCTVKGNMYVNQKSKCWIWAGNLGAKGYGKLSKKGETLSAHRFAYQSFNGDIPAGMHVLHKCDNRACVNPKHLFIGNNTDNIRDMHAKGRSVNVGVTHHDNRLTPKQVFQIRKDTRLMRIIADDYGISAATVCTIRSRETWKHLPEEGEYEKRYGKAHLTIKQMIAIVKDPRTQAEIAKEYGVKQAYVSKLKLGRVYKNLLNIPGLTDTLMV